MSSNYCVSCGQEIPEGDMICKNCQNEASKNPINRVRHRDNKPFILKKWNGANYDTPDIGDVVTIFGTDYEVVSNEPGNVLLKRKFA